MNNHLFLERTTQALGNDVVRQIQSMHFCILGCGAVGCNMADMLVRSGAKRITLVDGDHVELTNLNRGCGFSLRDLNHSPAGAAKKVDALKEHLLNIASDLSIESIAYHFRAPSKDDALAKVIIQQIQASDLVIIAMDQNQVRIDCEDLCWRLGIDQLAVGIEIGENGDGYFECMWNKLTPTEQSAMEGYGNGSYASIVMEACAVAVGMMLSHLSDETSTYNYILREFEGFIPATQNLDIQS